MNTEKQFMVWWIPQVPGKPFHVDVPDLATAKLLLETLANYDLWQYNHHIKPDYCNAGGLQVLEDGEWTDWYNDDGRNIDDITLEELRSATSRKS